MSDDITHSDWCDSPTDEDGSCDACRAKEEAAYRYWGAYFGGAVRDAANARRSLDLPGDASDEEVMAAARRLK